jgi:hypothetical protein
MDGRLMLGACLIVAGCLPADDLKGYSGGSEPPAGDGVSTVANAATTSEPSDPDVSPMSGGGGTSGTSPDDGATPLDPALDPGDSAAPSDSSGASAGSSGSGDITPRPDEASTTPPGGAEGDPDPVPPAVAAQFRFVRLVADSAVQGPYTSIAEFNVLDGAGLPIDRASWLASADSEETLYVGGAGAHYAIDGESISMWHTAWFEVDPPPPHPHTLEIDMGSLHDVGGFRYLGRQDGSLDGRIAAFRFFVSADGDEWGEPVATGTLANSSDEQEVRLP